MGAGDGLERCRMAGLTYLWTAVGAIWFVRGVLAESPDAFLIAAGWLLLAILWYDTFDRS